MDLKNKVGIVVGATGGMGSEVTRKLKSEGVNVILVSRSEDKLKTLSESLGGFEYFVCDLNKPDTISDVASKIVSKYPTIDFLFNVAGIGVYKPIEEVTEEDWMDSFNSNVTSSFYFTKYLQQSLANSEKGVVVNWGSGMGVIPTPGRSVYCASKFALRGMSLSLSKEFERTNIKIVLLTLGSVLTDFGPLSLEQKKEENLQGKSYLTPEYVAQRVIEIIKSDDLRQEIEIYPTDYVEGIR